jgi:hypothetical protein
MTALGPEEETEKVQTDFVKSAVRDVRYGPESLSEFTQWRVCPHPLVNWFHGSQLPWRSVAMMGRGTVGSWVGQGRRSFLNLRETSSLWPGVWGETRSTQDHAQLTEGLAPPRCR